MSAERERRVRDLFLALCELPEEDRLARLDAETAGDPDLRRAVEELLAEDAGDDSFLATPALGGDFRLSGPYGVSGGSGDVNEVEGHPEAIGPYRILGTLGSGGMGIVYRAEQQRPRRVVALKVLRADLLGRDSHRYFELEAQALGRLEHPGIARIHEAGTADFGRGLVPFLVMELVQGTDLVAFARERGLDRRRRVELVERVCRAVHHAHQRGVIHRDLKPGNVLVTDAGEPKVLDFGLARLTDEERSRSLESGDAGRILGTLAYMSPEQVTGGSSAVDAATDVYSLGATAYELLSGSPPFVLSGLALPTALHRVASGEPAPLRQAAPGVDRDLAAVVDRAMARAKEARYDSAAALADDLARWLRDEPVLARPAGKLEQARKFARRNRVLVAGACAVVLSLVAGMVGTAWQARSAKLAATRALRIKTYLQDTLRSAGDPRTDGLELTIVHVLDNAAAGLDAAFADEPRIHAELADTLGMAYFENGRYEQAETLVREALAWRAERLGPRSLETLASRHDLGLVLVARGQYSDAEAHLRAALEARRAVLGAEHEDTQRSANWLGQVLLQKADPSEAEALFADSWSVRRRTLGAEALPTLSTRENLALAWRRLGRLTEAEEALSEVLAALRRVAGPQDFELYEALNNLATAVIDTGRFGDAEEYLVEALEGYRRLRGTTHPDTRIVELNLETVHSQLGEARRKERAPIASAGKAAKQPRYYALMVTVAARKFYEGKIDEAEADLREAIGVLETFGGQERLLDPARQCLASVLVERSEVDAAIAIQREVQAAHAAAGTQLSQYALIGRSALAESLRRAGRLPEAFAEARAAHEALVEEAGEEALYTLSARANLAAVLADTGQLDESLRHAEGALRKAQEVLPDPSAYTEMFRVRFGRTLTLLERFADAEPELLGAHARLLELHGARGPYTRKAAEALVRLYEGWGRADDARRWSEVLVLESSSATAIEASAPR